MHIKWRGVANPYHVFADREPGKLADQRLTLAFPTQSLRLRGRKTDLPKGHVSSVVVCVGMINQAAEPGAVIRRVICYARSMEIIPAKNQDQCIILD